MKEVVYWFINLLYPPILIIVLSPGCFVGEKNVTKLEKLQDRVLGFVFKDNNSSYVDLLKRGNFLSLSAYRIRNRAMEVFKCFHGMNPMYLNILFCKQEIKYDLRDKTLLEQPKFSTKTYGYRSFKYYGSKIWNALPFEIKNTENYDEFKLRFTTWCHSSDFDKLEIFWLFFFLFLAELSLLSQLAGFTWPTWGPPGFCRPQIGPCWPHELCY